MRWIDEPAKQAPRVHRYLATGFLHNRRLNTDEAVPVSIWAYEVKKNVQKK